MHICEESAAATHPPGGGVARKSKSVQTVSTPRHCSTLPKSPSSALPAEKAWPFEISNSPACKPGHPAPISTDPPAAAPPLPKAERAAVTPATAAALERGKAAGSSDAHRAPRISRPCDDAHNAPDLPLHI